VLTWLATSLLLPLADEWDSGRGSVGVGILAVGSMALGFVLLWVLWYFVFRQKAVDKHESRARQASARPRGRRRSDGE
jgi:hypothetical protein